MIFFNLFSVIIFYFVYGVRWRIYVQSFYESYVLDIYRQLDTFLLRYNINETIRDD